MRLRTQLTLFFLLMTGGVLGAGLLSLWGGAEIVQRFSASLADVELLSQLRGLQSLLARERAAVDLYRRSRSAGDWARLGSAHRVAALRLRELSRFQWSESGQDPSPDHTLLGELIASPRLSPRSQDFVALTGLLSAVSARVDQAEVYLSRMVQTNQDSLRRLISRGGWLLFGFIFWELLFAFFFAWSTFRATHRALRVLQEGAQAFGEGRFDHSIPIYARDELGDLAMSFNRMAENIKSLETKTVHMHRMSAVGQLAGGVAHEINNPLTGVLGQAQILLEKLPLEDPRRSHAEKIERAAVRCRRIVRSLLDFSRKKETHFSEYDLHDAVESTLELCAPDFQNKRVNVLKEFSPLVPPMTGNAPQLQQVFLNMISNALHVMPNGGTLTITSTLAAFVPPGGEKKVDAVEISFQDTGSGISPEHLVHVFEPFFTTKEIGKGTGLGLSVSLGIVRNHGGDILVESEGKGRGALFRVFLPLSAPAHFSATPPPSEGGGARFIP